MVSGVWSASAYLKLVYFLLFLAIVYLHWNLCLSQYHNVFKSPNHLIEQWVDQTTNRD